MSDKQDKVAPRTASDIIQKYNFGKTFAETMGLAKSAKNEAGKSAKSVQDLDKKLDHKEVFNRLTKNGTLQGLYRGEDGELYVNASFLKSGIIDAAVVQVVNLIADHLKSTSGKQTIEIDGGRLEMIVDGVLKLYLATSQYGDAEFRMYQFANGKRFAETQIDGSGFHAHSSSDTFGYSETGLLGIDAITGRAMAQFSILNDKAITWKPNGDGTYTLIGTD